MKGGHDLEEKEVSKSIIWSSVSNRLGKTRVGKYPLHLKVRMPVVNQMTRIFVEYWGKSLYSGLGCQ
jgi:hypothetical protein